MLLGCLQDCYWESPKKIQQFRNNAFSGCLRPDEHRKRLQFENAFFDARKAGNRQSLHDREGIEFGRNENLLFLTRTTAATRAVIRAKSRRHRRRPRVISTWRLG